MGNGASAPIHEAPLPRAPGVTETAVVFVVTGLPAARPMGRLVLLLAASQGLRALWLGLPLSRWAWGETTVQIWSWPLGVWVELGLLELPAGRARMLRRVGPCRCWL